MLKNFIASQIEKWGFVKAEKLPRWLLLESESTSWQMPDPQVYENQANLYRKLSYIGAVVDIVTNSCIYADMEVEDSNEKEIDHHPFLELMRKPNAYDSRSEFLSGHFAWRKITGNSYWWLNRANEDAPPDEIWILPPSKVIPVPDGNLGLKGYLYYPGDGAEIPLETWEVLHFKSFNPFNRYLGLSAIESLAMTSEGALAAQEWNTRLFAENNARLPGILAFKNMVNDTDWERIKKEVGNAAAKRNNMMLRGVGDNVNWIQSAVSQREMEFLEGLDKSKQEIYDRLAPGLYNMLTSNSSLANGQTGDLVYLRDTVSPLLRETADKINSRIMPVYGEGQYLDYEDIIPEDKAMELAEINAFAQYHTIDEVRMEKYGNKPDPDPERGRLFAVQVGSIPQVSAPLPETIPSVSQPQPVIEDSDVEDEENPRAPDVDADIKADLQRWQRKARNNIGKPLALEFTSDYIKAEMHAQIVEGLKSCKSADDVKAVFAGVKVKPSEADAIRELARAIEAAVNG